MFSHTVWYKSSVLCLTFYGNVVNKGSVLWFKIRLLLYINNKSYRKALQISLSL